MDNASFLDWLPLWAAFLAVLLIALFSSEGGYQFGKSRFEKGKGENEAPISAMVNALLGLLALILAFTFGFGAQRFEMRRQLVLDEANAIGTTYLRTSMLPERGEEIRALLKRYVDVRLKAIRENNVAGGLRQSENIQNELWSQAVIVGGKHPNSIVVGLFVQSLNEVIDLHGKRVQAGLRNRVPGAIWFVLLAMSMVSLAAMGYHAGLAGARRSLVVLAVAFAFSAVIGLIADLDRPQQGVVAVGQHALLDLQRSLNAPAPTPGGN
jgi:hypothetical protein